MLSEIFNGIENHTGLNPMANCAVKKNPKMIVVTRNIQWQKWSYVYDFLIAYTTFSIVLAYKAAHK